MSTQKRCTACDADLQRIRLLDATAVGLDMKGRGLVELAYAEGMNELGVVASAPEAKPLGAYVCPECRRVSLYAD